MPSRSVSLRSGIGRDVGQRFRQIANPPRRVAIRPHAERVGVLKLQQVGDLVERGGNVAVGTWREGRGVGGSGVGNPIGSSRRGSTPRRSNTHSFSHMKYRRRLVRSQPRVDCQAEKMVELFDRCPGRQRPLARGQTTFENHASARRRATSGSAPRIAGRPSGPATARRRCETRPACGSRRPTDLPKTARRRRSPGWPGTAAAFRPDRGPQTNRPLHGASPC